MARSHVQHRPCHLSFYSEQLRDPPEAQPCAVVWKNGLPVSIFTLSDTANAILLITSSIKFCNSTSLDL